MATAKKQTKQQIRNAEVAAGIGAGMLAAASAAGYYFYAGAEAEKHRKAAAKWAKDMKKEVIKDAKKVQKLDKKAMSMIVDRAAAMYEGAKNVDPKEVMRAANELKANWKVIQSELGDAAAKGGSAVKKAAKTATASSRKAAAKKLPKKAANVPVKKAAPKAAKKSAKKQG